MLIKVIYIGVGNMILSIRFVTSCNDCSRKFRRLFHSFKSGRQFFFLNLRSIEKGLRKGPYNGFIMLPTSKAASFKKVIIKKWLSFM